MDAEIDAAAAADGGMVVFAAKILLSLRRQWLDRWPEWAPPPAAAAASGTDPGASESWEEEIRWPVPRWPKRRRSRRATKAKAAAAESLKAGKEKVMRARSPATPLEYNSGGGGSGASTTSGEEGYGSPANLRPSAATAAGDGGSGDEGYSWPAKRARQDSGFVAAGDEHGGGVATVYAVKMMEPKLPNQPCTANSSGTKEQQPRHRASTCHVSPPSAPTPPASDGDMFEFDLNDPLPVPWLLDN